MLNYSVAELRIMTKKFWLIALIVACTVVFGSCDKSEELSVEQCKLDMNLFNQTYTVNDEGCCVLKGRKPIAAEEIQSKVKGYGWESIATYEVQENGKLSKEEFWKDRFAFRLSMPKVADLNSLNLHQTSKLPH
jgi:hypothetical protein